jgi:FLVCR family MFS transporter 7
MDAAAMGHDYTYRSYRKRWLMLAIVCGLNILVQMMFTTLQPIATPAAKFYGVDLTAINWLSVVWGVLFVPGTFFAAWSLFKLGLRWSLILASAGLLLGSILRALSTAFPTDGLREDDLGNELNKQKKSVGAYVVLLLGSMIMAFVQPIILSCTTMTAAAWFSEKQRNLAITLVCPCAPTHFP